MSAALKRRRKSPAVPTSSTSDFGPDIRRQDITVPARIRADGTVVTPGYVREADTALAQRPDPDRPDRQQDIVVAIRWLPHRLYTLGRMTKTQLGAAHWYRDMIDCAEGVVESAPGQRGATMPSRRCLVTDRMIQARTDLQDANMAVGAADATLIQAAVTARSATEVSLAIGLSAHRVAPECARVFELLDEWRVRYARGR